MLYWETSEMLVFQAGKYRATWAIIEVYADKTATVFVQGWDHWPDVCDMSGHPAELRCASFREARRVAVALATIRGFRIGRTPRNV